MRWMLPVCLAVGILVSTQPARAADDWAFDVVRLKNGAAFAGLLVDESPTAVRFRVVRRRPGSPTVVIPTTFPRGEVAGIDRLSARDRALLRNRLQGLDPKGEGEAARMENLDLKLVPWVRADAGPALGYTSTHFAL